MKRFNAAAIASRPAPAAALRVGSRVSPREGWRGEKVQCKENVPRFRAQ